MAPIVITITGASVRLEQRGPQSTQLVEERAIGGEAQVLRDLLQRHRGTFCRRALLLLAPPLVQIRRVATLPPVARRELAAIVARQPQRYFRPSPGGLVVDAVWTQLGEPNQREAILAATDETFIQTLIDGAAEAGVRVDRVAPMGHESSPLNLLPARERARRQARDLRTIAALGCCLALLWLAIAGATAFRLGREAARLDARLVAIRGAAESVRLARGEVEQVELAIAVVDSLRAERGELVSQVGAVVRELPSEAFLTGLVIGGDSLLLAGKARSPARVVERLAQASGIGGVRLEAPRPRGPVATGGAPFEIVAKRRARP